MRFRPRPVQDAIPVWAAGFPGKVRPMRRAARCNGYFPVNLEHPDQLAEAAATIAGMRGDARTTTPYDIAVELPPDTDPRPYAAAGATWWLTAFPPDSVTVDMVRGVIRNGPA